MVDWAQVQATILGGIAVMAACAIPVTALVVLMIRQWGQIHDVWDQVNHHSRQLNSGMDQRIQAAVKAALEAASAGAPPADAASLAAAASHQAHQAQQLPPGPGGTS